jgi:hypothetical protein
VKQAAEYREHAAECLRLAITARNEPERQQLMQMAEAWERMAADREGQIKRDTKTNADTGAFPLDDLSLTRKSFAQ